MRRREFVKNAVGLASLGLSGCSAARIQQQAIKPKIHNFSPENMTVKVPKPSGTMPMGELGSTGIKVSKYGFGSHTPEELMKYPKEREHMLLEGYDLGIRLFDVYPPQYETTGNYLQPIEKDIAISMFGDKPKTGTVEEDLVRIMKMFGRDHIDMVRLHSHSPARENWGVWEDLFKLKEKGMIRAVGLPIHYPEESTVVLKTYPIDFVLLPYNFYHNILYTGKKPGDFNPAIGELRRKGIGIVVMKPFASEWFISHLIQVARQLDEGKEASLPQAAIRYILNSGLNPDATLGGMWYLNDVYENVAAYFKPKMNDQEKRLLEKVKKHAVLLEDACVPKRYAFLKRWADGSPAIDEGTDAVS
jgi:aryl-alcohol dehydrogenase-like predicted oxidoreductase